MQSIKRPYIKKYSPYTSCSPALTKTISTPPSLPPSPPQAAKGRHWYIQPSCATTGDGLVEGLDWLSSKLKEQGPRPPSSA